MLPLFCFVLFWLYCITGFDCHTMKKKQNNWVVTSKNLGYYCRLIMSLFTIPSLRSVRYFILKCLTKIYRALYGNEIFAPWRGRQLRRQEIYKNISKSLLQCQLIGSPFFTIPKLFRLQSHDVFKHMYLKKSIFTFTFSSLYWWLHMKTAFIRDWSFIASRRGGQILWHSNNSLLNRSYNW